jgi:hypothetical protein
VTPCAKCGGFVHVEEERDGLARVCLVCGQRTYTTRAGVPLVPIAMLPARAHPRHTSLPREERDEAP